MRKFMLMLSLSLAAPVLAQAQPPTNSLSLLQFESDDPQAWEGMNRRSDSRPLNLVELEKLIHAGLGEATLLELMRTRKVMVLADADTLIRLKRAGASDDVVAAVSAYAVPPNEGFRMLLDLKINSPGSIARAPQLYVEVWHNDLDRQEVLMQANIRDLMSRRGTVIRDRSDPMLVETVRATQRRGTVKVRNAGKLTVRLLISQKPGLTTLAAAKGLPGYREFQIDYPGASADSRCRLEVGLRRDPLMKDIFALERSHFECRWD